MKSKMGNFHPDFEDQDSNFLRRDGVDPDDPNHDNKVALPIVDEHIHKISLLDTRSNRNMSPLHKLRERAKEISAAKVIAEREAAEQALKE